MSNGTKIDIYPWGREQIIWGYASDHKYTFKILEPKPGREGCLSLQYHNEKSESWLVLRGTAWALVVIDNLVCSKLLNAGQVLNLPCGIIHRLMGVSPDVQVAEPSTPDRHAADATVVKDVVRLACVHGRECARTRSADEQQLVEECVRVTDDAIECIQSNRSPPQIHAELFSRLGFRDLNRKS